MDRITCPSASISETMEQGNNYGYRLAIHSNIIFDIKEKSLVSSRYLKVRMKLPKYKLRGVPRTCQGVQNNKKKKKKEKIYLDHARSQIRWTENMILQQIRWTEDLMLHSRSYTSPSNLNLLPQLQTYNLALTPFFISSNACALSTLLKIFPLTLLGI